MSRGQVVEELVGPEITEERIVNAAVRSTAHKRDNEPAEPSASSRLKRFVKGDYAPAAVLVIAIIALGGYILSVNGRYLNPFNTTSLMVAVAALGFISMGQTVALMMGGIDLSVGPLAGFLVVVASFFINQGKPAGTIVFGFIVMFLLAGATGIVNGSLIRFGRFTAVAATLTTYIALQGFSFLLRASPGGIVSGTITTAITKKLGRFPIAFLALVIVTVAMEWALRRRKEGLRIRAVGSNEESARRVGVKVSRTVVLGYVTSSIFVALGAVVLLAQLGIGDPAQGIGYTLSSITAVVLGGTSLLGGRGSFVGTFLGSCLIVQALNATVFLGLTQTWQYVFQGGFILVAALVYSRVRGSNRAIG
jgi:ribose transport system ATP-binding protein